MIERVIDVMEMECLKTRLVMRRKNGKKEGVDVYPKMCTYVMANLGKSK